MVSMIRCALVAAMLAPIAAPAAAQQQTTPTVMRRPMNPVAVDVAAKAVQDEKKGIDYTCIDVNNVNAKGWRSTFDCRLASGEWVKFIAATLTDAPLSYTPQDAQDAYDGMMQAVSTFFALKTANPGSPAKLIVNGKKGNFVLVARSATLTR